MKLVKRALQPFKLFLPEGLLTFYREFRREYSLVDRSQVVIPSFTPTCSAASERGASKITLISTCLNEAAHARGWLQSLLEQSRPPDEIVLADGGSTDGTVAILGDFAAAFPIPLKVIEAPRANISKGRNIAIQNASHPIVACTDFGCILDKNWLRLLVAPFEADEQIEASMGYYQAVETNTLSRLAAIFFGIDLARVNPKEFLPSGRSLAMKKTLWAKAGGYPEWLTDAGEDTLFDLQAKSQPSKWAFVPDAKVYWHPPSTLRKLFRTYFRYSRGDGEVGTSARLYWWKVIQFVTTWARRGALLLVGLALTLLFRELALIYWLGWLAIATYRFIRENLPMSAKLGVRFYPYTLILEIVGAIQAMGYAIGVRNRPKLHERQVKLNQEQLRQIMADNPDCKGIIVYPPTHDWGFMFQRPHQMGRTFARKGFLYFFCTINEKTDSVFGFQEVEPNLYLCHVPLETFQVIQEPIVYIGSAWHRPALALFNHPRVIYDHYDDLEVSGARPEDHQWLLQAAEVVLVTSQLLYQRVSKTRPDVLLTPNGVDYDWIQCNEPAPGATAPPDWLAIANKGHPIIGYSGALASWFDYDLLSFLAQGRPDLEFALIGVDYDGTLEKSGVLKHDNVHWLGMKSYSELFKYVWRFNVGIIPFKVNSITMATSPIKLFEYMACEKPVVSTALPDCKIYPGVFVAESYPQFAELIDRALGVDQEYLAQINAVAKANTWDSRVDAMVARLRPTTPIHLSTSYAPKSST